MLSQLEYRPLHAAALGIGDGVARQPPREVRLTQLERRILGDSRVEQYAGHAAPCALQSAGLGGDDRGCLVGIKRELGQSPKPSCRPVDHGACLGNREVVGLDALPPD
jgi:hypothetical protein